MCVKGLLYFHFVKKVKVVERSLDYPTDFTLLVETPNSGSDSTTRSGCGLVPDV